MTQLIQTEDLKSVAQRMRDRQNEIDSQRKDVAGRIGTLVGLASEQGQDIVLVKGALPRTMTYPEWLAAHVPTLDLNTSRKYERISTEGLHDPAQCMFAFIDRPQIEDAKPDRAHPAEWEQAWGFVRKLQRVEWDKWPEEQRTLTKDNLGAVVKHFGGKVVWDQ